MTDSLRTSLAPMLSVRNGEQAIEFYQEAFRADVIMRVDSPDGAVVAKLGIEGGKFWIADESPAHWNFSPETIGGCSARMILTVADPDAWFARAVTAGAKEVSPVADQKYGWRVGRLVDPYGHHWEIGKPL
jgi:PhnB protein